MARIGYEKKVLVKNDELAASVREKLGARGIFAINLIGSPGSGKTSLVEATARSLKARFRVGALTGDQATENDARRIRAAGIPALQITTGSECHLNAGRVLEVLDAPELEGARLLLIENVGNLICPASYDLGEAVKVAVLSVAEGDDKPLKYPGLFRRAELLVVNKIDLLPFTDFSVEKAIDNAREVAPQIAVLALSCKSQAGISDWFQWIENRLQQPRSPAPLV